MQSVASKGRMREMLLNHPLGYDVRRNEYPCPYCESLCNTAIPVIPPISTLAPEIR